MKLQVDLLSEIGPRTAQLPNLDNQTSIPPNQQQESNKTHIFQEHIFKKPTFCDICNHMIVGKNFVFFFRAAFLATKLASGFWVDFRLVYAKETGTDSSHYVLCATFFPGIPFPSMYLTPSINKLVAEICQALVAVLIYFVMYL